ncbi:Retroviral nucleocapsid protein Gag containing protein [Cricetulus griseus]|uniref:Retroviral nucleocapsid protein Gag containing protein n=1 Tax=Cricetulus griseus TaxID=10029 RepID=A0A061I463_CRIGR|nr:Retroviral nucleocapsid protein Gag containing protein [Cricetulus griseus]
MKERTTKQVKEALKTVQGMKAEIDTIKKTQNEGMLEIERLDKLSGSKDVRITNRIQELEERISVTEDLLEDIYSSTKENLKSNKSLTQNILEIWDTVKRTNLRIIGIEEDEEILLKDLGENRNNRNKSKHDKEIYTKPTANIKLDGEKLQVIPLKYGTRQGCPLSPYPFKIVLELLARAVHSTPYGIHAVVNRAAANMRGKVVTAHPAMEKHLRGSDSVLGFLQGIRFSRSQQLTDGVTPTDWIGLVSAVLENSCQIEWKALLREEGKLLEQQGIKDGVDAALHKILGEGIYADQQIQAEYDNHMLSLCRKAALNAWDKVREPGERLETYTKIEQGQTEPFKDFLDRLTRAVEIQVADPAIRHSIVYTLAYDNANPICKRILLPLKIRSAPLEEWVLHTAHIDCNMQDARNWTGEAVPRGFNRQQEIRRNSNRRTWEREAHYRDSYRYQEASAHC